MIPKATIDFETRSACAIKKCGSWRYSLDPTTEILCLAFRLPTWAEGRVALWHPAFPTLNIAEEGQEELAELFRWILAGGLIEAHNAWFERGIWTNICVPRLGWPAIANAQWRCSAAKAAAHALPRALEHAIDALRIPVKKDLEGAKVMKKMTKPRKPRKKELAEWALVHGRRKMPLLYHEDVDLLVTLWEYCCQDVRAEEALSNALPDLDPQETAYYLMDQLINERGFRLDRECYQTALALIASESTHLNDELRALTNGDVQRATQRARMIAWLATHGLDLPDSTKGTIEILLGETPDMTGAVNDPDTLPPAAKRGLEIMRDLGRSSTAKYETMRHWMCPDGRVHGGLLYHGASTGRWTGAGVQPHNFVKGELKTNDLIEEAWSVLNTRNRETIQARFPAGVMHTLSHALRGAITASPGKQLYVADYNAIECRVLNWLAGDDETLEMFRSGGDPYLALAEDVYGYPCNKHDHPKERALGKVGELGLGYQMGWSKFIDSAWTMGKVTIDETLSRRTVEAYRAKHWRTVQMWRDMEEAAITAVRSRRPAPCEMVMWVREGDFLYCILPSGRRLAYAFPEIRKRETPWGDTKAALTFMGVHPLSKKWVRQTTYGGSLVENITQAVARDLMAEAMLRCEQSGIYQPILSVHDELIAEGHPLLGDVRTFETLMAEVPAWAEGCPVVTEGWSGFRYRK